MGNAASAEEGGEDDPLDPFDGIDTLGYRVLGVQPDSPASEAGLVSFLDFLVGVNDTMLLGSGQNLEPGQEYDDIDLPAVLSENKGKPIEFLVWNIKTQTARTVPLTPSDSWGGAGLLGVTIRLDNYAGAEERLVRILQTQEGGPAATAGLLGDGTDYFLGTTHATFTSVDRLAAVLEHHLDTVVEVYVYNTKQDRVRVVALLPTYSWGEDNSNSSLLGAEVGTGYLHRLPFATRETEGSCVERKVRYVEKKGDTKQGGDGGEGLVELEPQLEMEPSEEEIPVKLEIAAPKAPPSPANVLPQRVEPAVAEEQKQPSATKTAEHTFGAPPPVKANLKPPPNAFVPQPPPMGSPAGGLGPPPQLYNGRPAYQDSRSAAAGYGRPSVSYTLPPPPQPSTGT